MSTYLPKQWTLATVENILGDRAEVLVRTPMTGVLRRYNGAAVAKAVRVIPNVKPFRVEWERAPRL